MGRPTDVDAYKHVWRQIGEPPYRVDDTQRIAETLEASAVVDHLRPRYAALHHDDLYLLLSVSGNRAIVASFELSTLPDAISYDAYDVDDHCRDRMVERNITTGTLREMLDNYVLVDRLEHHTFKLICRAENSWYRAIVDTQARIIETLWEN